MTVPQPLSVLAPASTEAQALAEVSVVLMAGATILFTATMSLMAMAWHRRRRPVGAGWWLFGAGLLLPVAVLGTLLIYSTLRTQALDRPPSADALLVGVTGHQWWWELRYTDPATGAEVVTANELRLPVGRPVRLALASADVIHSFWVPPLGGKMDLVPGRINHLTITAQRPGLYRGQCAEFCGGPHARMALHVVALAPQAFDRWLAHEARPAGPGAPADAVASEVEQLARGRSAFVEHGCAGCHRVRGVAETGDGGPDLTHVGRRLYIGAGLLPNGPEAMARWIADVQALKPGAQMPAFDRLPPATLQALSAYLVQLQ